MPRFVAFLRAVNVRPRWVKMAELRGHHGCRICRRGAHIQSGNVHLAWSGTDPDGLAAELTRSISTRWGFEVPTMVRRPEELVDIVETAAALRRPSAEHPDEALCLLPLRRAGRRCGGPAR